MSIKTDNPGRDEAIAGLLGEGLSYRQVMDRVGCGASTVARVKESLPPAGPIAPDDPDEPGWPPRLAPKPRESKKSKVERLTAQAILDAGAAVIERMKTYSPRYDAADCADPPRRGHLWEVDLFDVHFGKLAWAPETGENYDLKIAERVYRHAIADLIALAQGFPPARVLLPLGNDFFHVDSLKSATTAGTQVDSDGRYAKIIEYGTVAVIEAIDLLARHAPVDVLWVPGNHDTLSSLHLCREVQAWFRNTDRVTVDCGPNPRKYYVFGHNLIGFTHGDRERAASLPAVMLSEAARLGLILPVQHREWHLGHLHKYESVEDRGVTIRRLSSLSAADAWHHENGFVGARRAADVFVWGRGPGMVAHLIANARDERPGRLKVVGGAA